MEQLSQIIEKAMAELKEIGSLPDLDQWKSRSLGKKGPLSEVLKGLKDLSIEEKKEVGKKANELKIQLQKSWEEKRDELENIKIQQQLEKEWMDVTLPFHQKPKGNLHPLTSFAREIEDLFLSMGFDILDGPLVEDDWHNFEALNIPKEHPARDMQDTFFMKNGLLLRTHTSSVQIRTMEKIKPPFKGIAPGRVFRCEEVDASHDNTFYQVEGILIDKDISVSHLIFSMKTLLKGIFKREVEIRLRPGYFPFVEPGFELDIKCLVCGGGGCSVCKHIGWVELLPCGLVHPRVLEACKIDPNEWNGFAFGLGLTRLVMMKYGIDDIRHFLNGDLRFIRQFS